MQAFISIYSPLRHIIFPVSAVTLLGIVLLLSTTLRARDPLTLAWLSTFAFLFSSYVFTPQMNIILLPFFAVVPIAKRYREFLAFDILTAAIIVVGFSQPLQAIGITYSVDRFSYYSPVQWAEDHQVGLGGQVPHLGRGRGDDLPEGRDGQHGLDRHHEAGQLDEVPPVQTRIEGTRPAGRTLAGGVGSHLRSRHRVEVIAALSRRTCTG